MEAAWGPLVGRWSAPRAVGRWAGQAFILGGAPTLAEAPDGTVLLAWDTPMAIGPDGGVEVVWRSPGHPFGRVADVPAAQGAAPEFDAAGNAYLVSSCYANVLVARAHSRSFRSHVLDDSSVVGFTLSLSGPGRGVAAWVEGTCPSGESGNTLGPVFTSVLRNGRFGSRLALTPADAQDGSPGVVAFANGGGSVMWGESSGRHAANVLQWRRRVRRPD